jgi:vacuolar-type H+-ATPase subunit I/STV1
MCLQLPNHLRFNHLRDFYHGFIPQMLFLQSIFGYLVVCIVYKWVVDWSKSPTPPPSLLNMLIGMFLSPGTIEDGSRLYRGQGFVQTVLLLVAAVCVPWMLCVKPYLLWKDMKGAQRAGYRGLPGNDDGYGRGVEDLEGEEEGRAIAADIDDEHVSFTSNQTCKCPFSSLFIARHRSSTTLVRWRSIRSFTRSNSASGVSRIRRPTCVSGHCRLHTRNYPRCSGT